MTNASTRTMRRRSSSAGPNAPAVIGAVLILLTSWYPRLAMAARQSGSALVISSTRAKSLSRIGIWPSAAGSRVRALTTLPWVSDSTTSADSPLPVLTR